ncbi:MAG: MFS transporter [Caldilineaceae bacterium]
MLKQFSNAQFSRDAQWITTATGILAISFLGLQTLLKVLYVLRLGYGLEYLGVFSATGALAYMAMSLPSGAAGSYFGTRRAMLAGGVITMISIAITPLVEYLPSRLGMIWPLAAQVLLSGGWALFNVNLVPALMATTTPKNRSSAYALNSVLRGFGAFIGTLAGGLLPSLFVYLWGYSLDTPAPYRLGLWVAAALAVFALIPLLLVKEAPPLATVTHSQTSVGFPVWFIGLLILHVYFAQIGIAVCQTFCNAYMDTDLHLSPAVIGMITGSGQFAAMLAPLLAPRLAERYGNAWLLTMTTVGSVISLLPLAFVGHWVSVGIGGLGITALNAMWMPVLQVYQMELVHARWRSLAYGIISMAMSCTFASAGFFGGRIAARWGYQNLFLLSLGLCGLGVIMMWVINRWNQVLVKAPVLSGD